MDTNRKYSSPVWSYFDRLDNCNAKCKICKKVLSYKTSTSNLTKHYNRTHPNVFIGLPLKAQADKSAMDSNRKNSSPLWSYFDRIGNYNAKCKICKNIFSYKTSTTNLTKHFNRTHRNVFLGLPLKIQNKVVDPLEYSLSNSSLALSDKEIQLEHETQHDFFIDEEAIPSTSQHEIKYPKIKEIQSLLTSDNAAETIENDHVKLNSRKRRNRHHSHSLPSSKKLYSAAYELLQNEQHCVKTSENINLKSFGEYIDTELEKLDKTTCAVVKMEIHKIIYEAILKSYKKDDTEVSNELLDDISDADDNDEDISDDGDNMVHDSDLEVIKSSNAKEISRKNKENKAPRSSILCEQQAPQLTTNAEEEQTKRVKKKRLKSKDVISAVYDAIQTDTKQNTEQTITFGAYVGNELKSMDNLTITNAKLKICQILYEASLGKLKNVKEVEQDSKNNTKHSNAEQTNCNDENEQEVVDTNDDL